MTSEAIAPGSPVDVFDFTSDSEDYEPPTRGQSVALLIGTAFLAVPAGLVGLAVVPFIVGVAVVWRLANAAR